MEPHRPPPAWHVHVDLEPRGEVIALLIRGRLGTEGAAQVRSALHAAISAGGDVEVDLAGVDYISSAGLALLDEAAQALTARGGTLRITGASEVVALAFHLRGTPPGRRRP